MCNAERSSVAAFDLATDAPLPVESAPGALAPVEPVPDEHRRRMLRRCWRPVAKVLIAISAAGAGIYWMAFSPVTAHSYRIERGTIVAEVMGTGTLEARVQSTISPKISGRIEEIFADQGDRVKTGRPLLDSMTKS